MARTAMALFLALAISCLGMAQQQDLRMVNLSVVAVDGKGQPVEDLTADDFQITDAGQKQHVVSFRHTVAKPIPSSLPAGEFSNRKSTDIPYATVILFDLLNEDLVQIEFDESALAKELESLNNADYLYLYILTWDRRLLPLHGPDSPQASPGSPPWTREIKTLLDTAVKQGTAQPSPLDVAMRVDITYQALNALGFQLVGISGRKNVVWITAGVPIQLGPQRSDTGASVDFTSQLRQLSQGLEHSHIAIYPIRAPQSNMRSSETATMQTLETIDDFANITGGRPSGSGIETGLKQAMLDVRDTYQLGYVPSLSNWDNKLHKLRVSTSRKGIRLQTKTEYYAWSEPGSPGFPQLVDILAQSPHDAAEIGLRGRVSQVANKPETVTVDLHVDAADIALIRQAGQFTGRLQVALIGSLANGQTQDFGAVSVDLHYNSQQYDVIQKDGIALSRDVPLQPDLSTVRFIIYDENSESVGSITLLVSK